MSDLALFGSQRAQGSFCVIFLLFFLTHLYHIAFLLVKCRQLYDFQNKKNEHEIWMTTLTA